MEGGTRRIPLPGLNEEVAWVPNGKHLFVSSATQTWLAATDRVIGPVAASAFDITPLVGRGRGLTTMTFGPSEVDTLVVHRYDDEGRTEISQFTVDTTTAPAYRLSYLAPRGWRFDNLIAQAASGQVGDRPGDFVIVVDERTKAITHVLDLGSGRNKGCCRVMGWRGTDHVLVYTEQDGLLLWQLSTGEVTRLFPHAPGALSIAPTGCEYEVKIEGKPTSACTDQAPPSPPALVPLGRGPRAPRRPCASRPDPAWPGPGDLHANSPELPGTSLASLPCGRGEQSVMTSRVRSMTVHNAVPIRCRLAEPSVQSSTDLKKRPERFSVGRLRSPFVTLKRRRPARRGVGGHRVQGAQLGGRKWRHTPEPGCSRPQRSCSFQPNILARGLISGSTRTVGLLTDELGGRFAIPILLGVENALGNEETSVLLCDARGDPIRRRHYIRTLIARRVDGFIILGYDNDLHPSVTHEIPVPVVYVYCESDDPADLSVLADDDSGARLAAEHLISLGRKRIAHITGPQTFRAARVRFESLTRVLEAVGLCRCGRRPALRRVVPALGPAGDEDGHDGQPRCRCHILWQRPDRDWRSRPHCTTSVGGFPRTSRSSATTTGTTSRRIAGRR